MSGAVVTSVYSLVDAVAVGQSEGPIGAVAMAVINPFWGFIMFIAMIFGLGESIMLAAVVAVLWIFLRLNKVSIFYLLGASDA